MSTITNTFSELGRLIDQVSKDRGIEKSKVVSAIVTGLLSAARKKYGTYRNIEVKYNEEMGQLELYEFKEVVAEEDFVDEQIEIKLSDALKMDPEARIKDQIGMPLKSEELGRIDAYMARQIVVQSFKDAENEMIFNEFEKRKGDIVSGVVRREDRRVIVVDLDKVEAYIPKKEQIYGERYNPGDRIQGYILEVRQSSRGPQIIMSRAHPNYLIKLFEKEVPEIYEGIVKIVSAAREPGHRAKMAVYSNDSAVHPVGACVGMKGSRVQNITQELKGERIDVIIWDEDPVRFVCNALAPAKIMKVLVDEEKQEMDVVVADDQLSLAIGKKGQNVRLAVNLTKWNLNIMSITEFEEKKRQAVFNLKLLPDMTDTMAENIHQCGFSSFQELADSTAERIKLIPGYDTDEKAEKLIQMAKDLVEKYKGKEIPSAPELEKEEKKTPAVDAKTQADQKLKEELAQLEGTSAKDEDKDKDTKADDLSDKSVSAKDKDQDTKAEDSADNNISAKDEDKDKDIKAVDPADKNTFAKDENKDTDTKATKESKPKESAAEPQTKATKKAEKESKPKESVAEPQTKETKKAEKESKLKESAVESQTKATKKAEKESKPKESATEPQTKATKKATKKDKPKESAVESQTKATKKDKPKESKPNKDKTKKKEHKP